MQTDYMQAREKAEAEVKRRTYDRLGAILSSGEGGYESYNSGTTSSGKVAVSRITPPIGTVTGKTINQIIATNNLPATDPNRLRATGKYQTLIPTLKDAKRALGLTGNELYTPDLQERIFREYLVRTGGGGLSAFIDEGKGTVENAQYSASKIWASIAVPRGYPTNGRKNKQGIYIPGPDSDGTMSFYGGAANRANLQATENLRAELQALETARIKKSRLLRDAVHKSLSASCIFMFFGSLSVVFFPAEAKPRPVWKQIESSWYHKARPIILSQGWQPMKADCAKMQFPSMCEEGDMPEILHCTLGHPEFCILRFQRDGSCLEIQTYSKLGSVTDRGLAKVYQVGVSRGKCTMEY